MNVAAILFSCALSNTDINALVQAQQTLALLAKLTDQFIRSTGITADEMAAVATQASERLQTVLADLGSPAQPMFYVNAKEGAGHAC